MPSSRFEASLLDKKKRIDESLERLLPQPNEAPAILHESMRYSVFVGGKRLRPILALSAYEICGGHDEVILPVACGLELVHSYSLIHDDLPCMDDDDWPRPADEPQSLRRGNGCPGRRCTADAGFRVLSRPRNECTHSLRTTGMDRWSYCQRR